jgi:hypothetical protein
MLEQVAQARQVTQAQEQVVQELAVQVVPIMARQQQQERQPQAALVELVLLAVQQ